ncbi:MAG: hypothetical protein ACKOE2_13615, partial [Actinomycetales bacterium]
MALDHRGRMTAAGSDPLSRPLADVLPASAAKALKSTWGYQRVDDLLRHYPRRYAQRGELTDLATLVDGEAVTVLAQISRVDTRSMRNRKGTI